MMQQLTMETLWAEISNVPGSASVMQKALFPANFCLAVNEIFSPKKYKANGLKESSL